MSDEDYGDFEDGVRCWACPVCAFTFDAFHTDTPDGGCSCPLCAESDLRVRVADLEAQLARMASDANQMDLALAESVAARDDGAVELQALRNKLEVVTASHKADHNHWVKIADDAIDRGYKLAADARKITEREARHKIELLLAERDDLRARLDAADQAASV